MRAGSPPIYNIITIPHININLTINKRDANVSISTNTPTTSGDLIVDVNVTDNGRPVDSGIVSFKINGKTYYKTTNSKGQAKLTIKLKANKKYTVKVGFKSTSTYGTTLTTKIKVIR